MSAFNVGDKVIVRYTQARGRADRETMVTRVGRKYAYVDVYGHEAAYDAETGYEKSTGFATLSRILTPEMAAEEAERQRLATALKQVGIRVGYDGVRPTISLRDMQRLLDVMDNPS